MNKNFFPVSVACAALLLGGCDKQTKLTTEKIAEQTKKLTELQEVHAKQLAQLQEQLKSLGPMLDKMNGAYFEKSYSDALFFHTNTLHLLLAVDQQIESELKAAEGARDTERLAYYSYHTNQADLMFTYTTQLRDLLLAESGRLETNINAETRLTGATLTRQLASLGPDAAEITWRKQVSADLEEIKLNLTIIKLQLGITNLPTGK